MNDLESYYNEHMKLFCDNVNFEDLNYYDLKRVKNSYGYRSYIFAKEWKELMSELKFVVKFFIGFFTRNWAGIVLLSAVVLYLAATLAIEIFILLGYENK